jgi:hypothetical protein
LIRCGWQIFRGGISCRRHSLVVAVAVAGSPLRDAAASATCRLLLAREVHGQGSSLSIFAAIRRTPRTGFVGG